MSTEEQWVRLIEEMSDALHATCERLSRASAAGRSEARFFTIFVLQSTQDVRAITLLYSSNLKEPAQILVRALLECRFKFDIFVLRCLIDPNEAITLILDAMMLEKIGQAESTNFAGLV